MWASYRHDFTDATARAVRIIHYTPREKTLMPNAGVGIIPTGFPSTIT